MIEQPPKQDSLVRRITRFVFGETAATSVEYAVVLMCILLVLLTAIATVGRNTGGYWADIQSNLHDAGFGGQGGLPQDGGQSTPSGSGNQGQGNQGQGNQGQGNQGQGQGNQG